MNTGTGKLRAVALVRDASGKPKFNDINNIPKVFWDMLTEKEKEEVENDRVTLRSNS